MAYSSGTTSYYQPQQGTVSGQAMVSTLLAASMLWAGATVAPVAAEPQPIINSDSYTMSVDLWTSTIDNALQTDISAYLVDGSVEMNLDRDIKLSASFTLRDAGVVAPYTNYLAPFLRRVYDDGRDDAYQQVGLYATKVAPGWYNVNDSGATYEGADLTSVMATSYYTDVNNIAAAANYVTGTNGIQGGITGSGLSRYNLPATTSTLPAAQSFAVGTSRLEKANTLLDQLGWYHLGMDLDGRVSTPGAPQNLASKEPWRTLTDTDIIGNIEVQPTGIEIANVVLVINDDAASAPLHSTATNSDPSSPTSTVSIGRSIMRLVKVSGSTTQTALDALAVRLLAESRTYYRVAKLTILHDPTALIPHQTGRLTLTGEQEGLSGLWWIRTASMGLAPSKPTQIEVNQVTDNLNVVLI